MKILICTGIFPPDIGGPAQYAKNLFEEFKKNGHVVRVSTYTFERKFPSGLRHLIFFFKSLLKTMGADFVIALDTFSAGLPAVILGKLFRKKVLLRVGGDFLWETYTARGEKISLAEFYRSMPSLSLKEKIIYYFQKFIFKNSYIIFTTNWQKEIFKKAYFLRANGVFVIENYYGERVSGYEPRDKNFIVAARSVKFKNLEFLQEIFSELISEEKDLKLEIISDVDYATALEKIRGAYASILISISDISPNFILDTISADKPFIMTKETGLFDRLSGVGIFVDPYDKEEIKSRILFLLDNKNYQDCVKKMKNFNFMHSWSEIAGEFLEVYKKI